MKAILLRLEPVIWLLFGGGILLGTLLLPGYLLTVTLAGPLGLLPEGALSYDRVHAMAAHPVGRLVFFALIALPLWKGAHHCRSLALDRLGHGADAPIATLLYLIALAGTVAAGFAVVQL